ncbi:MAG TPA: antibiotic biosynthesis monooxygenase [Oscillatoriales cyanobacterium M59_W2019_021]|nr:MAG: antibiotic biosynthesis monooxygenase [Cyanobacteria bacterium J055]HIK33375.1 antibiotic biosynthesis monooxygenase [Oscillatoriales cyanobacterium M4454_W2019_049]HIK52377.1 antibiotic biosynthesis monooxygenase [Oscillatoriales cyanobacterium M59_W2019_021]
MSDSTVRVVARVVALPDKVEDLKAVLLALIEPTRQEAGCVQYELLHNSSDPTDFTFVETWASDADLDRHLTSPHLQEAFERVEGLLAAMPDIRRYRLLA